MSAVAEVYAIASPSRARIEESIAFAVRRRVVVLGGSVMRCFVHQVHLDVDAVVANLNSPARTKKA